MAVSDGYRQYAAKRASLLLAGLIALVLLFCLASTIGPTNMTLLDSLAALIAPIFPDLADSHHTAVLWHLRFPRLITGLLAGIGLGLSGAVMQAVTRNPLVSPFTIGISPAAAFGASLAIFFGVTAIGIGSITIIVAAFLMAICCAAIVFSLSQLRGASPETIVLAGIAISYFFSALTAVLQFFASEQQLSQMVNWTFGSLSRTDWNSITIIAVILALLIPVIIKLSWDLNAMMLVDDTTAKSFGISVRNIRIIAMMASSFITASIIAFTGIIGFVGLVAPHLARFIFGGDHRVLLPATAICGAILVITADIAGHILIPPIVIPIGIIISFVGVPMFLWILLMKKEEFWG